MPADPTRPLAERTPDELGDFVDDHLIMALVASDRLNSDRQTSEHYLRFRLVALSDTYPETDALVTEDSRRRTNRLRDLLS